ncbi:MAG TPA: prepilin-type N-terminal cleavage/methylation domain-containing protein [Candidatus Omnitrophota bacterium]|nr:prepilin-type N-terminal cleavage/methylation domain-containing protein [Candidatus Omnitrophota bacterium]
MRAVRADKKKNQSGLTLIEVLAATGIMAACISGLLLTYINLFTITDLMRDFTLAANAASQKAEELKRLSYDSILAYNNTTFPVAGFPNPADAIGRIEVSNATIAHLRRIRVVVSFRTRGRVIGEDLNLNGMLDDGENTALYAEASGPRLDSPVEIVTYAGNFTF